MAGRAALMAMIWVLKAMPTPPMPLPPRSELVSDVSRPASSRLPVITEEAPP
jgi:hypothetical protein